MASHKPVDTTTLSQGQAISQESRISRRGFEKSSPGERSSNYKRAEDDSKKDKQHAGEAVPEKQESSMASHGVANLLAILDQAVLQEVTEWTRRSQMRQCLQQKRITKSVSLSDEASPLCGPPYLRMQLAPCERPSIQTEWQEIDNTVKSVRRILHNPSQTPQVPTYDQREKRLRSANYIKADQQALLPMRCFRVANEVPGIFAALYQTRRRS